MKNPRFERYVYAGVTAIAVIAAAILMVFGFLERVAVAGAFGKLLEILTPIIYGAVLAFLLAPVYNSARRVTYRALGGGGKKSAKTAAKAVGTAASCVALSFVIYGFCQLVLPQLYTTVLSILETMPQYAQNIQGWLETLFDNNPELETTVLSLYQQVAEQFTSWTSQDLIPNLQNIENLKSLETILGSVTYGVRGFYKLLSNTLIGLIVMIYLLNIKDTLAAQAKKLVYAFLPVRFANGTVEEFRFIHRVFSGFIIGKLIDSLIIGILCFFLMQLVRLPFEVLISVIVGVTNVIPFFGPFIGAVPSALLIFLISPIQCLKFLVLILALQQFDGNILGPKILGDYTGLSSFWVLASILLFGGLFGFAGMIIAVPMTAVIFDLFAKLQKRSLRKKGLSVNTEDYVGLASVDEKSGEFVGEREESDKSAGSKERNGEFAGQKEKSEKLASSKAENGETAAGKRNKEEE